MTDCWIHQQLIIIHKSGIEKKMVVDIPFVETESSYGFLVEEAGQQSDLGFVCHHPDQRHSIPWNIPFQPSVEGND